MEGEFEIIENAKELVLIIPRKGDGLIILLTGGWCVGWIYILYHQIRDGFVFQYPEFVWGSGLFSLLCIFLFKTFLWHVRGKEKITLDGVNLKIERLGTFLTTTRKYEVNLIGNFEVTTIDNVPWWSKKYGFAGGRISFDYWDRPEYFGQTLNKKQGKAIVLLLNERMKTYAQCDDI